MDQNGEEGWEGRNGKAEKTEEATAEQYGTTATNKKIFLMGELILFISFFYLISLHLFTPLSLVDKSQLVLGKKSDNHEITKIDHCCLRLSIKVAAIDVEDDRQHHSFNPPLPINKLINILAP